MGWDYGRSPSTQNPVQQQPPQNPLLLLTEHLSSLPHCLGKRGFGSADASGSALKINPNKHLSELKATPPRSHCREKHLFINEKQQEQGMKGGFVSPATARSVCLYVNAFPSGVQGISGTNLPAP